MKAIAIGLLACAFAAQAQTNVSFPLWPDGAPGALGTTDKDIPTLTAFLPEPDKATGAAIVICPGGGYSGLAAHEGADYARFLNENGIAGFVLKYRLGSARLPPPGHAPGRRPRRAHRARQGRPSGKSIRSASASWAPPPAVTSPPPAHAFRRRQTRRHRPGRTPKLPPRPRHPLLRRHHAWANTLTAARRTTCSAATLPRNSSRLLSNELQVTKDTPPCFIWHTWEDNAVPVENSLQFAAALRQARVPFDLHIYQKGHHGIGLGSSQWDPSRRLPWTKDCVYWLRIQGFVK